MVAARAPPVIRDPPGREAGIPTIRRCAARLL
jgi:hypothetical protein